MSEFLCGVRSQDFFTKLLGSQQHQPHHNTCRKKEVIIIIRIIIIIIIIYLIIIICIFGSLHTRFQSYFPIQLPFLLLSVMSFIVRAHQSEEEEEAT